MKKILTAIIISLFILSAKGQNVSDTIKTSTGYSYMIFYDDFAVLESFNTLTKRYYYKVINITNSEIKLKLLTSNHYLDKKKLIEL